MQETTVPKRNLDKDYTFKGQLYPAGETEVPEDWPEDVGEEVKAARGRPRKQDPSVQQESETSSEE